MVIVWENNPKQELRKAYEYILKDSYQNAFKVRGDIVNAVLSLIKHPEKYPLDKYKRITMVPGVSLNFITIEFPTVLSKIKFVSSA